MVRPEVRTLRCGAPLIIERIPGVRSVGVSFLIAGGVAREPEDRQGMSAMWSELLFRGAGELDSRAHSDALDRLGAARSCSVRTFHLHLGATLLGARLHEALPLLTDIFLRPRADEASIEPTRDLCIQSVEGLRDEPQERVMENLRTHHNPPPLNRSSHGQIEGLKRITRDDMLAWWRASALPEGSIIAVAGDCDPDAVQRRLDELLEGWTGAAPTVTWNDSDADRGAHHETNPTNQVHIALAHDAPRESDENSVLERIIIAALSGGMSGRLFTEVREKRSLCYSVFAAYRADRDSGRVTAYAGTTPERAQETLDVLMQELSRINGAVATGGGVSEGEFQRAVVGMKSRVVMSAESTSGRAAALADDWHKLGRARSLDEIAEQIDAVTLDQVNARLADRDLGRMTAATIGPAPLTMPEPFNSPPKRVNGSMRA
ncbi:MAG: insulinase family protein [Phycisphaeraceae bacterium]|nr:MAG: insulinase family protein [Phycisphaeraceae bacterium]